MSHDTETLTRFLLGELPEAEADAIEEAFFAEEEAYDLLCAVESELIDAYAAGELSAERRASFEARFLHRGEMRERVAFARTLTEAAQATARPSPRPAESAWSRLAAWLWPAAPVRRMATVAITAALVLVIGLVAVRNAIPPSGPIALEPVAVRGAAADVHVKRGRRSSLSFELALDPADQVADYTIRLLSGDEQRWTAAGVAEPQAASIVVTIPSDNLPPGSYELQLLIPIAGTPTPVSYYTFTVD